MKTSDKLYNLNRQISLKYVALKQTPTNEDMRTINKIIAECIGEVREIEDKCVKCK